MSLPRSKRRKEDFKFLGFKRWRPIEKVFLGLMFMAFVAQFCIVFPREVQYTHRSPGLRGGFKLLQYSQKQTTRIINTTSSFENQSITRIASAIHDNLRSTIIKEKKDEMRETLGRTTKPITITQIRGPLYDDLHPHTRMTSPNLPKRQNRVYIRSYDASQMYYPRLTNARNNDRLKHLRNQCYLLSQNQTKPRPSHMRKDVVRILTSPTTSLVYCRVNKAASWYTINKLAKILNCDEKCMRRYSQRIRSLPYEKKKDQIKNSFKFLFVREPYGRLFSTYCNKFYLPKGIWDPIGIEIIRRYRKNPSPESLKYGYDVTFTELIRYTVDEFEAGNKMDAHIRPMYSNCKPCDYEYDFIGKLETFKSDFIYLAHVWKDKNITTYIPEDFGEKYNAFEEMNFVLSFLKEIQYSNIDVYNLYKRAWNYYQITSVISKHIDMPFLRSDNIKFYSFISKLKDASIISKAKFPDMKGQRYEALIQAYNTVPMKDLEKLKNVVREDCLLFGYDDTPSWLFDRETATKPSNTFNYFSAMHAD